MSDENRQEQPVPAAQQSALQPVPAAQQAAPQAAPAQPQQASVPPAPHIQYQQPQQATAASAAYSRQPQPAQPAQPQQPASAANAVPPQVVIPAPLTKLTGGMKFGWFVIGALLGIPGILIAWLANVDKFTQVKNDAIKFSAIGMAVWVVLWVLMCLGFLGAVIAAVAGSGNTGSSYYYGSYF